MDSIREDISRIAYNLSYIRRSKYIQENIEEIIENIVSMPGDQASDWHKANTEWGLQYFDKRRKIKNVSSHNYEIFEDVWLSEIKQHKAYYISRNHKNSFSKEDIYILAIEELRYILKNNNQYPVSDFAIFQQYIQERYLNSKNKLDDKKSAVYDLISKKAERLYIVTGNKDEESNWLQAEWYVKLYYNNIIPSILSKNSNHISDIVAAFSCNEFHQNSIYIINTFELLIASCFLDKVLLNTITNNFTQTYSKFKAVPRYNYIL